ncbi:MAG: NAD(P)H-dependent oxidoreductase [Chloroflexi bacterium]|nr:NAD(P)H-dependent oxidoreductase [Chloroflexota bacterium]
MTNPIHVLGFAGSLRKRSYNAALLRAAQELLPEGMSLEIYDITPIPFYNEDVEMAGFPEPVQYFKSRIAAADAVLIATPEYNYSMPGVLKNALDWASRPISQTPLNGKPLAIMGATTGPWGTTRAQLHLRQSCVFFNALPINKPVVHIARAAEKFDADLRLTDEQARREVRGLLESLAAWARRLKA